MMKKANKIIAGIILATGVVLGLTCCGGSGGGPSNTATGIATLNWNPPATNADGTPATDLAGYKIYYGTTSGNYTKVIDVGNLTSYAVNNLPVRTTNYFAVTAYDSYGTESSASIEVSRNL